MEFEPDFNKTGVNILLINGSPRPGSNTEALLSRVRSGVEALEGAAVSEFSFRAAHFGEPGYEEKPNALAELVEKWRAADGVVFAAPIYTAAGPGLVYTGLDLLESALTEDLASRRYAKAGGVLIQGSAPYGMAELGAQNIIERFVALHVIPSARLVGRVVDKRPPEDELLAQAEQFGKQTAENAKLIKLAYGLSPQTGAGILVLNAGVDDPQIGETIAARAAGVLRSAGTVVIEHSFAGKRLEGCHHCISYCGSKQTCLYRDDFQEFLAKWLSADGYLTIASANNLGPPSVVRRALDRLSEHVFQTALHEHLTRGAAPFAYPRYSRPAAAVVYGRRRYGGQIEALQTLIAHDVHRGNYPIGGYDRHSPLGAAGFLGQPSQLGSDQFFTSAIDTIAEDTANVANRLKTAKKLAFDTIPASFYASREKMGVIDKEVYRNEFEH
ncbi:MAG: NAD(P)H-dependent oxidoreductase [Treponema sp.]|jgi:multimeric flavodoxin WrbA|nr:NAD(P)H-dependent oxidoreductase [Treponema sp.]